MNETGESSNGANPYSKFHEAAANGSIKECEELLLGGEDINTADDLGWTPLMHAVRNGHCDLAKILLSHGADACLSNRHGITVFPMTVLSCDMELLETVHNYLTPELRLTESNNALQVACAMGLTTTVKWLLFNTPAQINVISTMTGVTALELAVARHHQSMVELLIQNGADPRVPNILVHNMIELVQSTGDKQIPSFLLQDACFTQPTDCFDFKKVESTEPITIDSFYTSNNNFFMHLDEDIVLKNSPSRPVFKTKSNVNLKHDEEIKTMLSPSMKSVFLPSPKMYKTPASRKLDYSVLISPKYNSHSLVFESPAKSLKRGNKRKLASSIGCSSWLKKFTKRRTKSFDNAEGSTDYDVLTNDRVDFPHFLYGRGLDEFYSTFKEQELDMWTFLTLAEEDLSEMGIHDKNSQAKILKCIETLRKTPF